MTTFTASKVRELAVTMGAMNLPTTRDMLCAYADRLEADEKTEAVAWRSFDGEAGMQYYDGNPGKFTPEWMHEQGIELLYTHPAPADAERLAEALEIARNGLRWYQDRYPDEVNGCDDEAMRAIDSALAAHVAQAQPPAASVTDEMVERARSAFVRAFVRADDGSTGITDAIRAALLAAQENPNG